MNHTINNLFALFYSANNVQTANMLDSSLSVQEYFDLLLTDEYKEFSDKQFKMFSSGWEGSLLHRLHKLTIELQNMDPTEKNYPTLNREFVNVLRTTTPILEKLARIQTEATRFDGFVITLRGNDGQEVSGESGQNS